MKKVYVSIIGESKVDGDGDRTEMVTEGEYAYRNGKYLLRYKEHLADVGGDCTTVIKLDTESVVMSRNGNINTQMIFEMGKRHMSHYETPLGSFTIGVSTDNLSLDVNEDGGNVEIKYILDINNSAQVENYLHLNIRTERTV
ncbi:MAG: DUF1934 domain-containing protein [Clostridia bacterium]|nr:DUF1934 domain-containing protein [Clostridia bacterium]